LSKQAKRVQPHGLHDPDEFAKRPDIVRRNKDRQISQIRGQGRTEKLTIAELEEAFEPDLENSD